MFLFSAVTGKYRAKKNPCHLWQGQKLHYEKFNKPILRLFFSCFLKFLVLVVELINATCCVNKFHLTCVERV